MSRGERRRQKQVETKALGRAMVSLPLPEEFLDPVDEPWSTPSPGGGSEDVGLLGALVYTLRRLAARNNEDSDRNLDLLTIMKNTTGSTLRLSRSDYDWLLSRLKEGAHTVWLGPDSAYLVRYIEDHVKKEQGAEEEGAK